MIVEERDYRIKVGKLPQFLEAYEKGGLPIQKELLGTFLGYFTTEIGELNHVVAWWSYPTLGDREERRNRMMADPRWKAFLPTVADLIDVQHSRVLKPVSFSPIK